MSPTNGNCFTHKQFWELACNTGKMVREDLFALCFRLICQFNEYIHKLAWFQVVRESTAPLEVWGLAWYSTKPPSKISPKFIINKYNARKAGLVYFLFKPILLCLVKYILNYIFALKRKKKEKKSNKFIAYL